MPTRREFLMGLALAPLAARRFGWTSVAGLQAEIWPEDHCLSQESASGFQLLLNREPPMAPAASGSGETSLIIVPGIRAMSLGCGNELLRRMQEGAWVILETGAGYSSIEEAKRQAGLLERFFGLKVLPSVPVSKSRGHRYIAYSWPLPRLVRTFEAITPIHSNAGEVVAHLGRQAVCAKKRVARGGLLYLGSMLGPGLFAEEPEGLAVGAAMVAFCRMSASLEGLEGRQLKV